MATSARVAHKMGSHESAAMIDSILEHLAKLVAFDTRNPPRAIGTDGIFSYLRGALPGAPPLGVRADALIFFWAELAAIIAFCLFIAAWARRGPAP